MKVKTSDAARGLIALLLLAGWVLHFVYVWQIPPAALLAVRVVLIVGSLLFFLSLRRR